MFPSSSLSSGSALPAAARCLLPVGLEFAKAVECLVVRPQQPRLVTCDGVSGVAECRLALIGHGYIKDREFELGGAQQAPILMSEQV